MRVSPSRPMGAVRAFSRAEFRNIPGCGFAANLILVLVLAAAPVSPAEKLPVRYREWLEHDAAYLITREEKQAFLRLPNDADRDHFIEQFWGVRNSTPEAPVRTPAGPARNRRPTAGWAPSASPSRAAPAPAASASRTTPAPGTPAAAACGSPPSSRAPPPVPTAELRWIASNCEPSRAGEWLKARNIPRGNHGFCCRNAQTDDSSGRSLRAQSFREFLDPLQVVA